MMSAQTRVKTNKKIPEANTNLKMTLIGGLRWLQSGGTWLAVASKEIHNSGMSGDGRWNT